MKSKINEINNFFIVNKIDNILLSISGGVDSIVLLKILLKIKKINKKLNVSLFHANYNFHNKSDDAQLLCKKISLKYDLKLHLLSTKIDNGNFEHNARKVRYNEIINLFSAHNYDIALTAHNYNDQLETLIMKDVDNSNWISRQGIRSITNHLYRPLLDTNKREIYKFAKLYNLEWIEDQSNHDIKFKRNKTRFLINNNRYDESYFTRLKKIKRISDIKYSSYLDKFKNVKNDYLLRKNDYFIELNLNFLDIFSSLETKLFLNYLLSETLEKTSLKITDLHWKNIYEIIKNGRNGLSINLSKKILLQKERFSIIISISRKCQSDIVIDNKNKNYAWYDSKISFKAPANNNINIVPGNLINNGSYISHWKNGDKISLKNSTKKISDLFIDNKISNYDKLYYPILKSNKGNVICVPNLATMYYNEFDESKCVSLQILNKGD